PVAAEWIAAVTFAAGTAALGYLAYKKFYVKENRAKSMVNLQIQKDNPKVVHAFDMEDLGDKAVYCRCWRSKKKDKSNLASEDNGDNFSPGVMNPLREKRQERYDDEVLQQGPLSKSLFSPQASSPSIIKSKSHTLSALQASACSYPQHSHCLKCLPKLDPCCQVLQPILRQEEPRPHS
ncbi:CDGSH iron sulfur domain-containing protein 1, partial [Cricetulus griseus]